MSAVLTWIVICHRLLFVRVITLFSQSAGSIQKQEQSDGLSESKYVHKLFLGFFGFFGPSRGPTCWGFLRAAIVNTRRLRRPLPRHLGTLNEDRGQLNQPGQTALGRVARSVGVISLICPCRPHTGDVGIRGRYWDIHQWVVQPSGQSEKLDPGAAVSRT